MVRLTAGSGLCTPAVVGGLFPRRSTSAAAPFSTSGPSGASEKTAEAPAVVHWPALPFWERFVELIGKLAEANTEFTDCTSIRIWLSALTMAFSLVAWK